MASARVFLAAEWRWLLMLNYAVDPKLLAPLVPHGVELDLWQGEALISLVGFQFRDTSVLGIPAWFHRHFPEVNLRFYVKRRVGDEWRRGVSFVSELVPHRAIAATARSLYNEPYLAVPMRSRADDRGCQYQWQHDGRWHGLGARYEGEPVEMAPGSAEEFIFEHYWGYTQQRDGSTIEYAVEHQRWRAWHPIESWVDTDATRFYGPAFEEALRARPRSVFVGEGSPVVVRLSSRL